MSDVRDEKLPRGEDVRPPAAVSTDSPAQPSRQLRGSFSIVSLGCPKNLVDSEQIGAQLTAAGLRFTPKPEGADLVVVNTCGFLQAAREESLRTIYEMVDLKRRGFVRAVVVTGCLTELEGEKLLKLCPGVDQVIGVWGEPKIGEEVVELLTNNRAKAPKAYLPQPPSDQTCWWGTEEPFPARLRLTASHVAYLKIAEGCDRRCTFCIIPKIRGHYRSRSIPSLVAEATALASSGVRELILVAQDTTYYGIDLEGRPLLAELLEQLDAIEGLAWIRLLYLYPIHVTDELIRVVATGKRIVPYLDIPLQHISDRVLRRMNRQVTRAEVELLLGRLRAEIPGLVLRTTLMTGFPGETDEDFAELCEFVRKWRFEHLGVFTYSPEPGAASTKLDGHVPPEVAKKRAEVLLSIQQEIAFGWLEQQIGQTREVMIDLPVRGEKSAFVGRTYAQSPEIDGVVYVTGRGLRPGQIVPCEIVARHGYDLVAVAVGKPRK